MISILGMHRSGTSALANVLHKLGADLGPESAWLQPAADNPRGFFEFVPVVDLNRALFAALGGTWSSPPALPFGWVHDERLTELRHQAGELSTRIPERMVVKDPRLSLTQPLWEEVGSVPATVLCLRHPAAVAHSLLVRNKFDISQGLFLWFRYNAAAILNRPDSAVVEYESLLEDPIPQLERVANHIALEVSAKTLQAAAGAVHRGMAHNDGAELPDTPIGVICERLYLLLRSREPLDSDNSVRIWTRLVTELPWAGPGDTEVRRARREVAELRFDIDRLNDEKERLQARMERVEAELRHALRTIDVVTISGNRDLVPPLHSDLQ